MTSSEVAFGDRHAGLARRRTARSSGPLLAVQAGGEDLGHRRLARPARARRTGRRGGPCRARPRCAACARRAPGRPRRRRCAGGGGGRATGPADTDGQSTASGPRPASSPAVALRRSVRARVSRAAGCAAIAARRALALWLVLPRASSTTTRSTRWSGAASWRDGRTPDLRVAARPHAAPARRRCSASCSRRSRRRRRRTTPTLIVAVLASARLAGWAIYQLGRAWFGGAAGALAAAIVAHAPTRS